MRPWVSKLAGCEVINFVIYNDLVGKLVERIFDGRKYLILLINEAFFIDAIAVVIDKNLWLSKSLDTHSAYLDSKIVIAEKVKLDFSGIQYLKPTISLPMGSHRVEISHGVNSLSVHFPVSQFVEAAFDYLRDNPTFNLADTGKQGEEFQEKWQKMMKSLV
ncbi:MAG: hypothetical protein Q8R29_01905 [bacterium]|nr:hypothetical protein [bacterium]